MFDLFKFNSWQFLNEMARRPIVCPLELRADAEGKGGFTLLRKSSIYKDLYALGFIESSPLQGEKQGNLRFEHDELPQALVFNYKGHITLINKRPGGSNRSKENIVMDKDVALPIFRAVSTDDHGQREISIKGHNEYWGRCETINGFEFKIGLCIKYYLYGYKWMSHENYVSADTANQSIIKELQEDPELIKTLKVIPPSIVNEPNIKVLYTAVTNHHASMGLLSWCKKNAKELFDKFKELEAEGSPKPVAKKGGKKSTESGAEEKTPDIYDSPLDVAAGLGDYGF